MRVSEKKKLVNSATTSANTTPCTYQDEHVGVVALKDRQLERREHFLVGHVEPHAKVAVAAEQEEDKADHVDHAVLGCASCSAQTPRAANAVSCWAVRDTTSFSPARARARTFVAAKLGQVKEQRQQQLGQGDIAQEVRREFLCGATSSAGSVSRIPPSNARPSPCVPG